MIQSWFIRGVKARTAELVVVSQYVDSSAEWRVWIRALLLGILGLSLIHTSIRPIQTNVMIY